ncbi:hypothetical protein L596_013642 [Steinernema carpocapsae]|uniref:Uncharacterized protein n=1 Tax=Steinernema carpocapsae TaxID=34508 RepID=A0A4U5P0S3_STECR|nr:hypothetical protein L596_013642 [Steinernema carpocapsae]
MNPESTQRSVVETVVTKKKNVVADDPRTAKNPRISPAIPYPKISNYQDSKTLAPDITQRSVVEALPAEKTYVHGTGSAAKLPKSSLPSESTQKAAANVASSVRDPQGSIGPISVDRLVNASASPLNFLEKSDILKMLRNVQIPATNRNAFFYCYNFIKGDGSFVASVVRARRLETTKWDDKGELDPRREGGYYLALYEDQYAHGDFTSAAPTTTQIQFEYLAGEWILHEDYRRTSVDHFYTRTMRKFACVSQLPHDFVDEVSREELWDHATIADILGGDAEFKEDFSYAKSGGARLSMRSARGGRQADESVASLMRDRIQAHSMVKIHLSQQGKEIFEFAKGKIRFLEKEARTKKPEFMKKLQDYFNSERRRLTVLPAFVPEDEKAQKKIYAQFPKDRIEADQPLDMKEFVASDFINCLLDFPRWMEFHYTFLLARKELKLVWRLGEIAVVEEGKRRRLRVKNSAYEKGAQPVRVLNSALIEDGSKIQITHFEPSPRPPSVDSESGLSTVMSMSTATTAPRSWEYHPWDMQPGRDEMVFRLDEDSLHNPKHVHSGAIKGMSERAIAECNYRIELIKKEFEELSVVKSLDALYEDQVLERYLREDPKKTKKPSGEVQGQNQEKINGKNKIFEAIFGREKHKKNLEPLGHCRWLQKCEKRLSEILVVEKPSEKDLLDLQVLLFVKERYEMVLREYDRQLKINVDLRQAKEDDSECFGVADQYRVDYNPTWRALVDQKVVSRKVTTALSLLLTNDQWLIDSDSSNLMLGKRCDRHRESLHFLRNGLTKRQNRILFIVFVVFLGVLFVVFLSLLGFLGWHLSPTAHP